MRWIVSLVALTMACSSDDGAGDTAATDSGTATDGATSDPGSGPGTDTTSGTASTSSGSGTSGGSDSATASGTASASGTTTDSSSGSSGETTGSGGAGCGADPGFSGTTTGMIDVGGMNRTYVLSLPNGYDPNTAYPLIFAWHGRGGDGMLASTYFGIKAEADADGGAIIVYPDGLPQAQQGNQTGWDLSNDGPDVALFDALLAELTGNLCVNESRVFSTGHSFGGYMSNTLGCARDDVLRAIAPVAGGGPYFGCGGGVAAWITHGLTDPVVPFSEGEGSRDHWVSANGCGNTTQAVSPDPCVAYDGCTAGMPVVWCPHDEVSNIPQLGAHLWPSFAAAAIWDFFSSL